MKCPLCNTNTLINKSLEENLNAKECSKCNGYWIPSTEYWRWLNKKSSTPHDESFVDVAFHVEDSKNAKICPDCGRILLRFKVGHDINFYLEHCNSCNGVWLDKNEWEVLKSHNLHYDLHRIFTTSWQEQIRAEELNKRLNNLYTAKFGAKDYEEIKRIKKWIEGHPLKSIMLAYLTEPELY